MRKDFLKVLSDKQLITLEYSIAQEQHFRSYQRNQKALKKLPPLKSLFANLTDGELQMILED